MPKLSEIIYILETAAPLAYQENYDNSGIITGDREMEVTGALLCIDVTLPVIEESVRSGINLIISHHPVLFNPIKKLTGSDNTQKILIEAIRNGIALYSAHTNLDNVLAGVNQKICEKLGLVNTRILVPRKNGLYKLITYAPLSHADVVRSALFSAGAGFIGNYDSCSFNTPGQGTFRAGDGASPFAGEIGKIHFEEEIKIETVFPGHLRTPVVNALLDVHPYEEVAYDIYALENSLEQAGSGMIGELEKESGEMRFLETIKEIFCCRCLRHSKLLNKPFKTIAVCGGSGAFLLPDAMAAGADLFVTGEMKYHQFFEAEDRIVVADMGHFESEQFTIEIFYDILKKNLPNFAIHFSSNRTSPIYYL